MLNLKIQMFGAVYIELQTKRWQSYNISALKNNPNFRDN
jgi:hypothetical protein